MAADLTHLVPGQTTSHTMYSQQPQVVDSEKSQKSEEDDTSCTNMDIETGPEQDAKTSEVNDRFLVEFDGADDLGNPKNWTPKRRWAITVSMGLMVFTVTFASSIFSVNIGVVQEKFNVELVTATLGVALFVLVCLR
jgi:hypothetical protein